MADPYCEPQCVVGRRRLALGPAGSAVAADEAVDRKLPLWLVHAIDSPEGDPDRAARDSIAAEQVVGDAFTAIGSTGTGEAEGRNPALPSDRRAA
ncbi:hypothetical protein I552_1229 [Mycobacterium xenopi 3993]|nr:hypothetical protein I552_1229 [Mycobacterium xenopi 3993]